MAEGNESTSTGATGQEPHGTEPAPDTVSRADYDKLLAESRKWEARAKENRDAAKRLAELEDASKTDAEKMADAVKRADEAEAKLAQYEADAQFAKDAAEVSEKYGVPASLLTERDRSAMELQAQAIKAFATNQPSARVFSQDGTKPGKSPEDPKKQFADWLQSVAN